MSRSRKTKAEQRQEWDNADRRHWEQFRSKLEAAKCFADARKILSESPLPDAPGRRYYSNLGFFLQEFHPPANSTYLEKDLYIQFIRRMDSTGDLKPGVKEQVEKSLRNAMSAQGQY